VFVSLGHPWATLWFSSPFPRRSCCIAMWAPQALLLYVPCTSWQLCAEGSTQVTHGRSQQGCQSQWQGCGGFFPSPFLVLTSVWCADRTYVVCVQLHGGMHVPAQQTVGRVNKARHLHDHVAVSQGLGGPYAQLVIVLRIHVHNSIYMYIQQQTLQLTQIFTFMQEQWCTFCNSFLKPCIHTNASIGNCSSPRNLMTKSIHLTTQQVQ
jgi:hypothetical protein